MQSSSNRGNANGHRSQQVAMFSPRDLLDFCQHYWYVILLSVAACVTAVWFYLRAATPIYKHTVVIMLKDENPVNQAFDDIDKEGGIFGNGIQNELFILKSNKLMSEVVDRLHLDVSYEAEGILHTTTLYTWSPVTVYFMDEFTRPITLVITPVSVERFEITEATIGQRSIKIPGQYLYGKTLKTPFGNIAVTVNPESLASHIDKPITVNRVSKRSAVAKYVSRITPSVLDGTTLIKISCTGENTDQIDDILRSLVDVYSDAIIQDRAMVALNSAKFIDERIETLGRELGEVENQLSGYQENSLVLTSAASGGQSLASSKSSSNQIETDLYIAGGIRDYINNTTNEMKLVPNVSGVSDANIQVQISNYNELVLQRERLLIESGENNAVVKSLTTQINNLRGIISGSMDNYITNLNMMLQKSRQSEDHAINTLRAIPRQEKMAQGIMRKQSIKESIYTNLLNKREENAMKLAVTQSDVRLVENPSGSDRPVSPDAGSFYLVAIILGIVLPILVKLVSACCNMHIRGWRDVEAYTTLPVIGQIPIVSKAVAADIINFDNVENELVSESFRMLRSNIRFVYKDAKVLMLTSTIPAEGKSFIARNLSAVMAKAGKRVLLIDGDLRRHTQSNIVGGQQTDGLASFLSGLNDNVDSIIVKNSIAENIDFIPSGSTPPNPSELLMGENLDILVAALRNRYDYIILDSVPAMMISDAVDANRVADMTLYIISESKLDRRSLADIELLNRDGKLRRVYAVLNSCSKRGRGYGYGHGYKNYYYYKKDAMQKA